MKIDTSETLAPVRIYGRVGINFPEGTVIAPSIFNNEVYAKCINEYRVWSLARVVGSNKHIVTFHTGMNFMEDGDR